MLFVESPEVVGDHDAPGGIVSRSRDGVSVYAEKEFAGLLDGAAHAWRAGLGDERSLMEDTDMAAMGAIDAGAHRCGLTLAGAGVERLRRRFGASQCLVPDRPEARPQPLPETCLRLRP